MNSVNLINYYDGELNDGTIYKDKCNTMKFSDFMLTLSFYPIGVPTALCG